ncbi:MAG: TonB-dependent receptor, partial [Gemmatimonadetes bacterium]|nr:TonB-dependent receptor [Gemmatimonadota bacterium]
CSLVINRLGYLPDTLVVDNTHGAAILVQLQIDALRLTETIVTGEQDYEVWRTAESVGQVSLSPKRLEQLPTLGEADVFRSLQLLPGISGVSDGSSGLYVQGGTPDQNLVLFDGMTVYHVDHFFGMFSAFNADAIKDIQIYRAGFPARYGGRLSSVVDLTSTTGMTDELRYSAGANLLSARAFVSMPIGTTGSAAFSLRRSYSDIVQSGFYNDLFDLSQQGDDEPAPPSANLPGGFAGRGGGRGFQQAEVTPLFHFYDLTGKVTLAPSSRDVISWSLYSGRDNLDSSSETANLGFRGFNGRGAEGVTGTRSQQEVTEWGNLGSSLSWGRQWSPRLSSSAILSASYFASDFKRGRTFNGIDAANAGVRAGVNFVEDNDVQDVSWRLDNEWHLSQRQTLSFGWEATRLETDYDATFGDSLNTLNVSSTTTQSAIYLQDEISLASLLTLTPGLRYTRHSETGSGYVDPRFAAILRPLPFLSFKAAWGRYHQFIHNISSDDVLQGSGTFWLVADDDLPPQQAVHRVLGAAVETTDYLLEAEIFDKDLQHLVEFTRPSGRREIGDYLGSFFFGDGISRGATFMAQKKRGALNGWMTYTLGEAENTFAALNAGEPFAATHDRRHEFKWVSTYHLGPWSTSASWVISSGRPYTAPSSQYDIELADGSVLSYVHVGDRN